MSTVYNLKCLNIDMLKEYPIYMSLNKYEQQTINSISMEWPMCIERIAEIYLMFDKNEAATRVRVARECFFGYNKFKRELI